MQDMENIKNYEIKFKPRTKMAELKALWGFLNILGYTTYIYALFVAFTNVDVFTRTALALVGLAFMVAKLVDFILTRQRKHRMEILEYQEKKVAIREREIAAYEKETEMIKSIKLRSDGKV